MVVVREAQCLYISCDVSLICFVQCAAVIVFVGCCLFKLVRRFLFFKNGFFNFEHFILCFQVCNFTYTYVFPIYFIIFLVL